MVDKRMVLSPRAALGARGAEGVYSLVMMQRCVLHLVYAGCMKKFCPLIDERGRECAKSVVQRDGDSEHL